MYDVGLHHCRIALNFNGAENSSEELLDLPTLDEAIIKPSHNVGQQSPIDAARRPKMMENSVTASCIHTTAAPRPPTQNPIHRLAAGLPQKVKEGKLLS